MTPREGDLQKLIESVEHEEDEAKENERHAREAERKYHAAVSLPRTMVVEERPGPHVPGEG